MFWLIDWWNWVWNWFFNNWTFKLNNRHLSDVDKDGKLTEDEFIIACWLIANRVRGKPIPNAYELWNEFFHWLMFVSFRLYFRLPPTVLPKKPTEPSVADKLGANPLERLKNLDLNSIMSSKKIVW